MKLTRLPARYAALLMPFVLSILMTFVVSGVATLKNLGFSPEFLPSWMSAWLVSWLIAFPTLLGALPVTRRIVQFIVRPA
ncbi:cellulose synthase/poly-beta-1,6-N-acetylglucosamine synthase-like glycosyltransferase [Neorhizobium sp. 2083]|uniref:DUF2798 domain-containing protein n=1 Tax=Neorhizobium sp. 2083 TaxID=2817762 RepID=UPI00285E6023|nr:DUF2798 domain-containing protein [Neorhizobium sp. 2083]MDR6816484.1 cellulose synthase/poly-beta-1,6-N-acetylglucosamine synthase-like glycosyltransferase [Neorhizobium sp. 2083]